MRDTVLLVVDVQKLITVDTLYNFTVFRDSLIKLIDEARNSGVEVIYVRHDDGAGKPLSKGKDGYDVADDFAPKAGEKLFDKTYCNRLAD